jgi:hypothetical protein
VTAKARLTPRSRSYFSSGRRARSEGTAVELALLTILEDLLVARLDLLVPEWSASVLLGQPSGEQGPVGPAP